jgi:hypothetical protein
MIVEVYLTSPSFVLHPKMVIIGASNMVRLQFAGVVKRAVV